MNLRASLAGLSLFFLAAPASAAAHSLAATLDGNQQVPAVVTAGNGAAALTYDDTTKKLTGMLSYTGTGTVSAIHIHTGARGANGGVSYDIGALASPIAVDVDIDAAEEATLLAGGMYFNVHTDTFPNGEIRGQIEKPAADAGAEGGASDAGGSSSSSSSGGTSDAGGSSSSSSSSSSGASTTRPDGGAAPAAPATDNGGCATAPSGSDGSGALLALGTAIAVAAAARGRRRR